MTFILDPYRLGVAGAFNPESLTNLHYWFHLAGDVRKNEAGDPVGADGDTVVTWYSDRLSPNNYWTQNLSSGATYHTGGPNGEPYVTAGAGFSGTGAGWTGGITLFLVARAGAALPSSNYWFSMSASDDQSIIAGFEASGMVEYHSTPRTNLGSSTTTDWAVYEFVDLGNGAASSAVGLKNGTATETLTGSSKTFSNSLYLLRGQGGYQGDDLFTELIVYSEGKNSTDRSTVRAYLGTKYGITVS